MKNENDSTLNLESLFSVGILFVNTSKQGDTMRPDGKRMNKIFPILGIFAVAVILSVSLYFIMTEEYKSWMHTEGVLLNVQKTNGSRINSRGYNLYYVYVVDGKGYRGQTFYWGDPPKDLLIGGKADVWYNPDNCSKSICGKPSPGLWPYIPYIFAIPIPCLFSATVVFVEIISYDKDRRGLKWNKGRLINREHRQRNAQLIEKGRFGSCAGTAFLHAQGKAKKKQAGF